MRESTVQIAWLVAMVTKISNHYPVGNDCFSQNVLACEQLLRNVFMLISSFPLSERAYSQAKEVLSYQNWSFYASEQLRYQ